MPAERQHPQRQGVDPRERHVGRADLERHDVVAEARQHRDDEQEDHERGVHREDLVVGLIRHELQAGRGKLDAHAEREQATDEEEQERVDDVHDPDLLVIGRRHPVVQGASVGGGSRVERGGRHEEAPQLTVRVPTIVVGWTEHRNGYEPAARAGTW